MSLAFFNTPNGLLCGVWADLCRGARNVTTIARNSSSALQLDDGKMLSVVEVLHYEMNSDPILSSGLKARPFLSDTEVHAHGSPSFKRLVWAMLVVPVDVERYLPAHGLPAQRDKNSSSAFLFQGTHQSFDHGDAAIFLSLIHI